MTLTPDDPEDEVQSEYFSFAEIEEAIRDEHYDTLCPDTIEHRIREEDGNPEDTQRSIRAVHGWYHVPKLRFKTAVVGGTVAGIALGAGYSLLFAGKPSDPSIQQFMMLEGVIGALVGVTVYIFVELPEKLREKYQA